MLESIAEICDALTKLNKPSPFSHQVKASDEFLLSFTPSLASSGFPT